MLMKHFRNILLGMIVTVSAVNITFAAEVPKESVQTTAASVSEEAVLMANGEAQSTKRAEEVLERGVPLHQAVTVNNVTLTLVSLYSDAYNYYMVVTFEKADHTTFKEIEQLDLMEMDFETKEEMVKRSREKEEAAKLATSNQPVISFEEMVKAEAEKDKNLKQFIREDGTIDKEGYVAYYKELHKDAGSIFGSYGSECRICQMKDSSDKKIYFLVSGSKMEPMLEVMQFYVDQLVNTKQVEYEVTSDLIDYLKAHGGEKIVTQPNQQNKSREQRLANIKDENPEVYKHEMERITLMPKNVLMNNDLNLQLLKDQKNIEIDSIGFVDGKLHVLITNHGQQDLDTYRLGMLDAVGNEVYPSSSEESSRTDDHGIQVIEEYSVFDIPNVEALSRYKLIIVGQETEIIAKGPWNMDVKTEPTKEKITKACNETITYGSHQQAVIKELELTPLSLVMNVENENKISNSNYIGTITLNMKDGSKITLDNINAEKRDGKNHFVVYTVGNTFIDTKEVASITVRNKTILL